MAVLAKWAGHYHSTTSDKVWAGCYTDDGLYIAVWGKRGSTLSRKEKRLGLGAARREFEAKCAEKREEGYGQIPFGDAYYRVPDFVDAAPTPRPATPIQAPAPVPGPAVGQVAARTAAPGPAPVANLTPARPVSQPAAPIPLFAHRKQRKDAFSSVPESAPVLKRKQRKF